MQERNYLKLDSSHWQCDCKGGASWEDFLNAQPQGTIVASSPVSSLPWQPERGEETQLFNLQKDIGENKDLSKDHADLVKELQAIWDQWNGENRPVVASAVPR